MIDIGESGFWHKVTAAVLKDAMIEAGKAFLARVPVEVEVTIGETWAEK